jgi:hypothetical protein
MLEQPIVTSKLRKIKRNSHNEHTQGNMWLSYIHRFNRIEILPICRIVCSKNTHQNIPPNLRMYFLKKKTCFQIAVTRILVFDFRVESEFSNT